MRWWMVVLIGLSLVVCLVAVDLEMEAPGVVIRSDELLDRRMALERLNNGSVYAGWEATFSFGRDDRELVMTGSPLCGTDLLEIIPRERRLEVERAGFTRFRCSHRGVAAYVPIRPVASDAAGAARP